MATTAQTFSIIETQVADPLARMQAFEKSGESFTNLIKPIKKDGMYTKKFIQMSLDPLA